MKACTAGSRCDLADFRAVRNETVRRWPGPGREFATGSRRIALGLLLSANTFNHSSK